MAFKSSSSENPLCRIIDMTDTNYEYDAPQFFDFARVNEEIFDDENDYFSTFCSLVVNYFVVRLVISWTGVVSSGV